MPVHRSTIIDAAVIHHVHPGQQGSPGGAAGNCLAIMFLKKHPFGGEPIQVRGLNDRMAETAEAFSSPLVRRDQKYLQGKGL